MILDRYPAAGLYGVVKTHGFGPWIIRAGTKSWADHAFVTIDDQGGIIEAEPGGVRKGYIGEYWGERLSLNTREPMSKVQRQKVASEATKMIGVPYNDLAILGDGLEALGVHWRWLLRHAAGDHELICSQLASLCGARAGMDWLCGRSDASEVTPADLAGRTGCMAPWTWL